MDEHKKQIYFEALSAANDIIWYKGDQELLRNALLDEVFILKKEPSLWAIAVPGYVVVNFRFAKHEWPEWPPSDEDFLEAMRKLTYVEGNVIYTFVLKEPQPSVYEAERNRLRENTKDPEIEFLLVGNVFFAKFSLRHTYCPSCYRQAVEFHKLGVPIPTEDNPTCDRLSCKSNNNASEEYGARIDLAEAPQAEDRDPSGLP